MTLNPDASGAIDKKMAEYFDHLYYLGHGHDAGDKLLAAWIAFNPEYNCSSHPLFRARRALKGWRKAAPGATRAPAPQLCVAAVAGSMMAEGDNQSALFIMTAFSTYGRPGEIYALQGEDILAPVPPYMQYTMELAPWSRQIPSKAGHFDEALLLDDPDMPYLGKLLHDLARHRLGRRLWDFSMKTMVTQFEKHCRLLGFWPSIECLYQLRHGGASHDKFVAKRQDSSIQRRGRWSAANSLRRYEKHGRVQSMLNKTTDSMRIYGRKVLDNFQSIFLKRLHLPPPVTSLQKSRKISKRKLSPASSRVFPVKAKSQRKLAK